MRRPPSAARPTRLAAAALAALLAACAPQPSDTAPDAGDPPPPPVAARGDSLGAPEPDTSARTGGVRYPAGRAGGGAAGDSAVQRLYREAYAIASAAGCNDVRDCRAAPVGAKPCGGPWEYVLYCRLTTDTARLQRTLAELERRQREYNRREGMASTCEMIVEPTVALAGGRCAAAP